MVTDLRNKLVNAAVERKRLSTLVEQRGSDVSKAIADLGRVRISGFLAWLAWCFIHILFLVGFRNRALVLFEWAWAYFTDQRGARLITGPIDRPPP